MVRKVKSLIFDLDGVLIDSFDDVADALNFSLATVGLQEKSYDEIKKHFGNGIHNLVRITLGEEHQSILNQVIDLFKTQYHKTCLHKTVLYPDVEELLEHYQDKNLAVVTNKAEEFARYILEKLKIEKYFTYIMGPESVEHMKPHPEAIIKLLHTFQTEKDETVMIGDSASDIEAGKGAGVLTCAATYGFGDREKLIAAQPDFRVGSLVELKNLFY